MFLGCMICIINVQHMLSIDIYWFCCYIVYSSFEYILVYFHIRFSWDLHTRIFAVSWVYMCTNFPTEFSIVSFAIEKSEKKISSWKMKNCCSVNHLLSSEHRRYIYEFRMSACVLVSFFLCNEQKNPTKCDANNFSGWLYAIFPTLIY